VNGEPPFWGKYRGRVADDRDPLFLARLQVEVPSVLGDGRLGWALPAAPVAGPGAGLLAVPRPGARVWVEFEGGDPDYPIWTGAFWGPGELPPAVLPSPPDKTALVTPGGHRIVLDDTPGTGGIEIQTREGAKLVLNVQGVTLATAIGHVKLTADGVVIAHGAASVKLDPARVVMNNGALEVI
jgi:uncharacterized protein involved in type VI secretion and phage assembly